MFFGGASRTWYYWINPHQEVFGPLVPKYPVNASQRAADILRIPPQAGPGLTGSILGPLVPKYPVNASQRAADILRIPPQAGPGLTGSILGPLAQLVRAADS